MQMKGSLVSVVVLVALITLSASGVFAADMFSGTWKMNIEKSTFSPGPALKEWTLQFRAIETGISVRQVSVVSADRTILEECTVTFDGKESDFTEVRGNPPSRVAIGKMSAKKIDDYTIELIGKYADGMRLTMTFAIAKDGKAARLIQHGSFGSGRAILNTITFEKQ